MNSVELIPSMRIEKGTGEFTRWLWYPFFQLWLDYSERRESNAMNRYGLIDYDSGSHASVRMALEKTSHPFLHDLIVARWQEPGEGLQNRLTANCLSSRNSAVGRRR
jgi:hypothetical protein